MGEANREVEDGSVDGLESTPVLEVAEATSVPVFPRWMTSAAIYAISAALAGGALALLAYGPLHEAAPLRQPIPQPAMFAVVCVLFGAALWAPVSLHHRGNTLAFALDPIPIMLGLVFLRPALLVLSAVCAETFVYAIVRKLPLIKVVLNVALIGFSSAVCGSRLPRAARIVQPCQLARLGRRSRRPVYRSGDARHRSASRLGHLRPDRRAPDWFPADVRGDAHRGEHLPRAGRARRGVVRPLGGSAPPAGRRSDHRGLPGLRPPDPSLRITATPLRLQPGARHREPRTDLHEHRRAASGVHGHARPSGSA